LWQQLADSGPKLCSCCPYSCNKNIINYTKLPIIKTDVNPLEITL
jgi:hypothetical protein